MSTQRNARRLRAKAKRDMFVRRGLVSARIFRMTAPTPHAQKQRLVLIDRLIALSDKEGLDPIRVFETCARNRQNYDVRIHGASPAINWFDDYAAQLKAEKELRDAVVVVREPSDVECGAPK